MVGDGEPKEICPICEEWHLDPKIELTDIDGRLVISEYSVCAHCKSETATPEQVRANKARRLAIPRGQQ